MYAHFPTSSTAIQARLSAIDPIAYCRSRNFIDGAVTRLSPYLSRGFLSTSQIFESVRKMDIPFVEIEQFYKELAWRDYFQRVLQHKPQLYRQEIRFAQTDIRNTQIPRAVVDATTSIAAIDQGIRDLYESGYLHNHLRMYVASLCCNIAKSHFSLPAKWMYYHLLDADVASNYCSWQWVAGAFASKKYYANQENINRYTHSQQHDTFLDLAYEELPNMAVPLSLKETIGLELSTQLPQIDFLVEENHDNILIYNTYNLDPDWHKDEAYARVLLLEPSHFERFPVSGTNLQWMLELATDNIPDLSIFVGEFAELRECLKNGRFTFKEHPLFVHYEGIREERDWMFPAVTGYYPSFFAYWKQCQKYL